MESQDDRQQRSPAPAAGSPAAIATQGSPVPAPTGKEAVTRISAAIEREGEALEFAKDERPFSAHVTLGRVRSPKHRHALVRALQECAWKAPAPWRVTSLTLYQSVLGSGGPRYNALCEAPLKGQS